MREDWRLTNQMEYLYRVKLKKAEFHPTPKNDHEHCEFCWEKFGPWEDALQIGYCTLDEYYWICEPCFADFKEKFEWQVEEQ